MAFRLEQAYSKDYILELFLNQIYLGSGSYGLAAAALNYFNKSLDELTLSETAYLAGLPKAPSRYHPVQFPKEAKIRRDYVIRRMLEDGHITQAEAAQAFAEPLVLRQRDPGDVVHASYFAEEVRRLLVEKFGEKSLYQEGLVVRTSLDPGLQQLAQESLRQGLITYDRRHGWRGPICHLVLSEEERRIPFEQGDAKSPWVSHLRKVPPVAGMEQWRLAVVLNLTPQHAIIGLKDGTAGQIPLSELTWARKYIHEYALGEAIVHPRQVVSVGDVVLVDKIAGPTPSTATPCFKLCQIPQVSGGIIVIEQHTGRVLAMHGGFSFDISQFNRATQALRQMGSAFKPFVYLTALEKGLTPSTLLYDGPFSLDMGPSLGIWQPHNYEKDYLGEMTLRRALELSRNLVTVRMTHEILGIKNVKNMVKKLGVVDDLPLQLATVLGSSESTLLKVTTAYGIIANGGRRVTPTFLDRVQDREGKNVYVNQERLCEGCTSSFWPQKPPVLIDRREQVLDPRIAYQMVSLLQGAVERGTARALKTLNRPIAGKTGTSNNYQTTWFVGFVPSPPLVVGVYVGFDTPRDLGQHESGARVSLPIFKDFMEKALKDKPAIPFRIPAGVKLMKVNAMTGQRALAGEKGDTVILEAFTGEPFQEDFEARPVSEQDKEQEGRLVVPGKDASPDPQTKSLQGTGGLY